MSKVLITGSADGLGREAARQLVRGGHEVILHARDEDGSQMTDRQLRDEAMTLFLAGHETTALALTYTLHALAGHR